MPDAPLSTYRLQLGAELTFAAATDLLGYLHELGITHVYLSPVLTARAGSTHGYDVADTERVAAALGGEDGLRDLAAQAHARGLGIVVDIVPNHVGVGADNPLWESLLAHGQKGEAASFFDVAWDPPLPGARGKVILPALGDQYGVVLERGELEVVESAEGGFRLRYFDRSFPLSPESTEAIARAGGLPAFRGEQGQPTSWQRLHALLEAQHFRLVHWRAGHALINYRRFFAIDDLAALRVEDPTVFDTTHATILRLVDDGVIDGLRVDHPDGLRDPARYFQRLAERTGGIWTVVEKITEPGEALPDWPVAGTTGYELANDVLGLFVDPAAREPLLTLDQEFGGDPRPYEQQAAAAKRDILATDLAADLQRLSHQLWALAQEHPEIRDVDALGCLAVVARTLQGLTVYRTYVDPEQAASSAADRRRIAAAVARARQLGDSAWAGGTEHAPPELYDFLSRVLCGDAGDSPLHRDVLARFQQLSGAVMAKGVEDTAFYRYLPLVALNEVGGDPARVGLSVEAFHEANLERARRHPTGMLTTATHDTKRGEDARLRIAALSEIVDDWTAATMRWREANRGLVVDTDGGPAPDPQTELLCYQTLVALWPADGVAGDGHGERLSAYLEKASREARRRTSWTDPDAAFEGGVSAFVQRLLAGEGARLDDIAAMSRQVRDIASVAGLAQTLLRCTVPGVPDTYQGREVWDDSLVDPDNRRPVDFARRRRLLAELDERGAPPAQLCDDATKLWVLSRALRARRDLPATFGPEGTYEPLAVDGALAGHVVAFVRGGPDGSAAVVVVPRLPGHVLRISGGNAVGAAWQDTAVTLAGPAARRPWRDVLTGTSHDGTELAVTNLFATLPVALLVAT